MEASDAAKLRDLVAENAKRKLLAEAHLDIPALKVNVGVELQSVRVLIVR